MPGTKGKSGGPRKGAGRPQLHFRLTLGGEYAFSEKTPDGILPMRLGKIIEIDRQLITFELEDGSRMTIFR